MKFSDVLRTLERDAEGWTANVPDEWLQGRTAFGGLTAALAVNAMRELLPSPMPLRTLQATFLAPVPAGPMAIRATLLRTGKNAVHVEARVVGATQTLALLVGVFGAARESVVRLLPQQMPVESKKPMSFGYVPGLTPAFTQNFTARWLRGGFPFSGARLPQNIVELSLNDSGPTTEAHVLALADFIPPVALSLLKKPSPGSTLTWMLEFFTDRLEPLALQNWRVDADLIAGVDGYTSQSVMLWGPGGEPVALSRQSMVVFG